MDVRQSVLVRARRILAIMIIATLAGIVLLAAPLPSFGLFGDTDAPEFQLLPAWGEAGGKRIALVSGHAGNDSGAVCEEADGTVTLTEAEVNTAVAEQTAARLRSEGATVTILDEFDPRLHNLSSDLFLSIHADSCIDASGYKAASHVLRKSSEDQRLIACIDRYYPATTGLPNHPNTVTHNMTEYHAFSKIAQETPAAIIELGFLGGDRMLLEDRSDLIAQGVAESLLCFLRGEDPNASAAPSAGS